MRAGDTSANERYELWQVGFDIIGSHPFFGVGHGAAKLAVQATQLWER